ncbi:MAG: NHL repeat-containing protein, partial [candidate division WOR-3 bacterium]|nr:NHL repeat-containing protein [candidate division WOR-3 bacterium]
DNDYLELYVVAFDELGNVSDTMIVFGRDYYPPITNLEYTEPYFQNTVNYVNNNSAAILSAYDDFSGFESMHVKLNDSSMVYNDSIVSLSFAELRYGINDIEYYSIDQIGNTELTHYDSFFIDNRKPLTELIIDGDYHNDGNEYVSDRSILSLVSSDDASGVDTTIMTINDEYADIDNSILTVYGLNSVEYYSIDNVENTEDINARAIYMDNVVPNYSLSFNGEYIDSVPYIINMNTQITINGTDDLSGVKYIHYSIDNTSNTIVGNSLNIPEEGPHTLYIKLSDNVNNITGWQSEAVYVDNTPPEVTAGIGLPKYNDYITSESPITLSASDEIAGVREVIYYINGTEYTYNEPFTITGADGEYTIEYKAIDRVGNESDLQSMIVNLDNTSPDITINYNEPQYYGEYQFVSSQSLIDVEAYDTGSGQKRITYDINGILSGEGASALTISLVNLDENVYNLLVRAWDNLDNEAEKQDEFVIDDSHPVTDLAVGDPQYIKSDTMLITSNTPLELTATDKPDNTPASGVYEMIYGHISPLNHVNNSNYTDYVNDEDGVYQYRYYSVDNLDNTEPVNERTIELDNTAPEVIITYPYDGIFINQDVPIKGYADDKNFRRWKLEYRIEEALSWNTITDWQTTVPSDSSLGQFNASELQSGVYTVKLTAEDLVENMNTYEITIKGGEPQQDLELTGYLKPEGVWGGDYIYIADTQHKRVVKTNEDNSLLLEIREFQPRDVFVDSRGRLFTTDLDNKVYVYSSQGDEIKTIDGHLHPKGLEVRFNKIYVADTYKNRIVVYNMNGEIDMTIPVNKHPEGIAVDEDGNIFTCIDESNEIRGYSSTGEEIFRYGVVGHGLGEFVRAVDIDVDSKGYLWVCDRNNNRIHMIDWRNELDLFILGERGQ